jgi:hypothetical protein
MKHALSPDELRVLDYLLTRVANQVHGVVHFWVMLPLLPDTMLDRHEFVKKNSGILRAFITVIKSMLAANLPAQPLLQTMIERCHDFETIFAVLLQFRTAPLEEVREATVALAEARQCMLAAILQLGEVTGCSISYWQQRADEHERQCRELLEKLFDFYVEERASGTPAPTAAHGISSDATVRTP